MVTNQNLVLMPSKVETKVMDMIYLPTNCIFVLNFKETYLVKNAFLYMGLGLKQIAKPVDYTIFSSKVSFLFVAK